MQRPFVLADGVALLARTPEVLSTLLRDLPEDWTDANEGPSTWSPFDVVGHLIHGEMTDWLPRVRIILEHGEARPFEKFDRFAQEKDSAGQSLAALLATFDQLRRENLVALRTLNLTADDLNRRGRHPAFGSVTLGQLLATWVAHDLDHVMQVSRVLARQYSDAVGPWSAYLRVISGQQG